MKRNLMISTFLILGLSLISFILYRFSILDYAQYYIQSGGKLTILNNAEDNSVSQVSTGSIIIFSGKYSLYLDKKGILQPVAGVYGEFESTGLDYNIAYGSYGKAVFKAVKNGKVRITASEQLFPEGILPQHHFTIIVR